MIYIWTKEDIKKVKDVYIRNFLKKHFEETIKSFGVENLYSVGPIIYFSSIPTKEELEKLQIISLDENEFDSIKKTFLSIKDNEKIEILQLIRVVNNTFSYEIIILETSI